jgi:hypothetical protein
MNPYLDISHYISDDFKKVCDVANGSVLVIEPKFFGKFYYRNIDEELMFSKHNSWVYMIVDDKEIVKVGETGNPLGVRTKYYESQPNWNTKSRLGRLAFMNCNTDGRIRRELDESTKKLQVSIWAKKCDTTPTTVTVGGQTKIINLCYHKDLELAYLDYIYDNTGSYPRLNIGRK